MKLPKLSENAMTRDLIGTFGGYHRGAVVPDNAFYDMQNLSSEHYPCLSPRIPRGIFKNTWTDDDGNVQELVITAPSAMICKDELCYTDGVSVVIGNESFDLGLSSDTDMLPKRLVSMGAYLIVLPDQAYINTADTEDRGMIRNEYASYSDTMWNGYTVENCNENGDSGEGYFYITCDTEGFQKGQRVTAVKAKSRYIDAGSFPDGYILGSEPDEASDAQNCLIELQGREIHHVADGKLIFKGTAEYTGGTRTADNVLGARYGFTLETTVLPDMDFAVESENRIWGCYRGEKCGKYVNEIYASALGSFRDFYTREEVSTDAYTVSVGSDGPFTGAAVINGYPYFFKERCYHKIYGSYPAQYQVQTVECKGIQQGSERSAAMVNGMLFYKAADGVCCFDGSYPTDLSVALGDRRYADAVGGSHRYKYYVSMRDIDTDAWSLFVYDTLYGMWHREDDLRAMCFCDTPRALYCIPASGDRILDLTGGGKPEEAAVPWFFETGMIACETVDRKFLHNISSRWYLPMGTALFAFIEYDSCGQWEYLFRLSGAATNTFTVPILPRRCDHFRLRFSGTGDMKLFALTKSYTKGSAY